MTGYHLHLLHASMVSRGRAVWAWEEADRIEALTLQAGVVDALRTIGWIVDVDNSEADYGQTRWLLWVRDVYEAKEIVEGTPLGYLGLLKAKQLDVEDAPGTREWLERVREEWRDDPKPPAPGNILERFLEKIPLKEVTERFDDPDFGDAERILAAWAIYRNRDQANRQNGVPVSRDNLLENLLRLVRDIRRCDDALARLADLEYRKANKRAILGEHGIDPDNLPE